MDVLIAISLLRVAFSSGLNDKTFEKSAMVVREKDVDMLEKKRCNAHKQNKKKSLSVLKKTIKFVFFQFQ